MATTGQKISAAKRGTATVWGERHGRWKGDAAGYHAIHKWIYRNKPRTGSCANCGVAGKRTEFANVSGKYRRDVNDFRELCPSCHWDFDQRGRRLTPVERQAHDRDRLRRWRAENPEKYRAQRERQNARRRKVVMPS